ncbi:uncharacterized protein LOC125661677 isoform X2 [Ostrea edulis]|nr:uncharacterized protein LOC125661677 isoform X2 [Ostrea edulis]XP_048749731.2 uncharacterized protein LOC125661677 isoform X2 [Ostrea edulis]
MACSKYKSTKETTHAARVSRLVVDPCTDLFRDLLRNHVTEIQFPPILQNKKNTLSPILNKVQRPLLYPNGGYFNGTYTEFDLSLLYILLRNISGILSHRKGWGKTPDPLDRCLSANIDRIREIRNKYCGHSPSVSLPDPEFHTLWQDLTIIIGELEGSLPGGCSRYSDAANQIKTDTMDPEQEKKYMDIIDEQYQSIQEVKDTTIGMKKEQQRQGVQQEILMSEVQRQDEKLNFELHKQGGELQKQGGKVQKQGKELKRLGGELQRQDQKLQRRDQKLQRQVIGLKSDLEKAVLRTEKVSDSEKINILDNTSAVLNEQKSSEVYVRTSAVQATINKLQDDHIAILTGKGGTGKTTTAYQVMCELSDESSESPYKPVLINFPEQWEKVVNPNDRYIAYLDDFIGATNLDTHVFEKWKVILDKIYSCAEKGNVMVMIGLRRNILDEGKIHSLHKILDERYIIDLSSEHSLTLQDKANILEAYTNSNVLGAAYKLSYSETHEIIHSDPYYGFPLTCFQFFSKPEFFRLGPSYFKRPNETLFATIEKMRKSKSKDCEKLAYCVLCYVLIHGSIDVKRVEELFKTICEKVKISYTSEIDIKDAIEDLIGLYLSEPTKQEYKFSHETISEAVLVSFGQLAPDIVIKRCSLRKVNELIRTQNYESKPEEVVLKIHERYYEDLAQKLLRGDDGDEVAQVAMNVLLHPACSDSDFVSVLCNREMSVRLSSVFSFVWANIPVWSMCVFYYDTRDVLKKKMLEHFGPHHSILTQSQSEDSPKNICTSELPEAQLSTPRVPLLQSSVKQTHEAKYRITCEQLRDQLKMLIGLRQRNEVITLVQYISKYKDLHYLLFLDYNVLHYCVTYGWETAVDTILAIHKPTKSEEGWSCAHIAAFAGRPSLLQRFVDLGQDIGERTQEGYSVLQAALVGLRYGQGVALVYNISVLSKGFYFSGVLFPGIEDFKNVINICTATQNANQCLIKSDLALEIDEFGNNVVHYIVVHNYGGILPLLLEHNKDIVFHRNNSQLPTTLHVAVYLGRPELVRTLWEAGVRPRDSDLSLSDTRESGENLKDKTVQYNRLLGPWIDGTTNLINVKLKIISGVNVHFGNDCDFRNIKDFLRDKQ